MAKYNIIMVKYIFRETFLMLLIGISLSLNSYSLPLANQINKQMVVVIDPGHGGKDPGAINKGIREKDVVLGVGIKLGKFLNENFSDVKVIFTRNTDVFVPLIDRSRIANKNKADLFISIHANICGTPSIRGTETFTLGPARLKENFDVAKKENSVILLEEDYNTTYEGFDPNSAESYIMFANYQESYMNQSLSFANDIQQHFDSRSEGINRGVKQAGFLVLRQSSMPSVLIETGFLSNASEANYLKSEEGQRTIALSIFEAFKKFKARNFSGDEQIAAKTETVKTNKPEKPVIKPDTASLIADKNDKSNSETKIDTTKPVVNSELKTSQMAASAKQKATEVQPTQQNTTAENKLTENNTYYSIQIAASTTSVEPIPANFKGLKNIRREKTDKYYRYYIGNESSAGNLTTLLQQIRLKYPQAFIVSFVNGQRIVLNTETK
jgi:N-acetylmuramoyl-L-alanine amidase